MWSSSIAHRDAGAWHVVDTSSVFDVSHFSAVWEAPDGTALVGGLSHGAHDLLRYEGSGWTLVELRRGSSTSYDTTTDIGGTRADDVWVSGADDAGPSLTHWDGHAWTDVAFRETRTGHAACVWTTATNDGYVGGDDGDGSQPRLDHFDGERWAQVLLPPPDLGAPSGVLSPATTITDVWGTSARDVWVGDAGGNTFHFDGDRWRFLPIAYGGVAIGDVHGWSADSCDVFVSATEMFIGAP